MLDPDLVRDNDQASTDTDQDAPISESGDCHRRREGNPRQRWRSLFVDQIEEPVITNDPWQTADNYTPNSNGIDHLHLDITPPN